MSLLSNPPTNRHDTNNRNFPPMSHPTTDAGEKTPQLTTVQKAANDWSFSNWHDGKRIAGADNAYVAFWAFCAGAASSAPQPASAPPEAGEPKQGRFRITWNAHYSEYRVNIRNYDGGEVVTIEQHEKEVAQAVTAALAQHKAEAEKLRALLQQMLNVAENADDTGYVTDVGFVDLDKLHAEVRAAMSATPQNGGMET